MYDNLNIRGLNRCTEYCNSGVVFRDTFVRGDQPMWGTATSGQEWTGDENIYSYQIGSNAGYFDPAQVGELGYPPILVIAQCDMPDPGRMEARFRFGLAEWQALWDETGTSFWHLDFLGVWPDCIWFTLRDTGALIVANGLGDGPTHYDLDQSVSEWSIKASWGDGQLSVKCWPTGDAEPDWQITTGWVTYSPPGVTLSKAD